MKRIVLFCERNADLQTRQSVAQLAAGLGEHAQMLTLGRGGDCRNAAAAAWRLMHIQADVVHAWSDRCLHAATFTSRPLLYTPSPVARPAAARWLHAAAARQAAVRAVCLNGEDHRCLIEHGVPAERCDLVRPGVKLGGRRGGGETALRAALGAPEGGRLVLLAGDAESWISPLVAVQAVAILHYLDRRYRLLVTGNGSMARSVSYLASRTAPGVLIDASEQLGRRVEMDELTPAADLAISTAAQRLPSQGLLCCMAGGVPLVAVATRATSELLEDHHTALLASDKAKNLAQRLLLLTEDPVLASRLADRARDEAYRLFSVSRFVSEMRLVYDKFTSPAAAGSAA